MIDDLKESINLDLYKILKSIAEASIVILDSIQYYFDDSTSETIKNSSGDFVNLLDIIASTEFLVQLGGTNTHSLLDEEEEEPTIINEKGKYRICIDPLDGSSNIGLNNTIGSIFSIYKNNSPAGFLRKGKDQVAAGYILYGYNLEMIVCVNNTISRSVYYPKLKRFVKIPRIFDCPKNGKIYSVNYCNKNGWLPEIAKTNSLIIDSGKFTQRYSGSLVADFHRILLEGGIFAYHGDNKNPNGKLRMLYECFPIAKIIEAAGGLAVNDAGQRILDLTPTSIHEKSSIIMGSYDLVDKFYAKFKR